MPTTFRDTPLAFILWCCLGACAITSSASLALLGTLRMLHPSLTLSLTVHVPTEFRVDLAVTKPIILELRPAAGDTKTVETSEGTTDTV